MRPRAKPAGRHYVTVEVRVHRHRRQRDRGQADHPGHPSHLDHECPTPPQLPTNCAPERERCDDQRHHRIDPALQPHSGERRDYDD